MTGAAIAFLSAAILLNAGSSVFYKLSSQSNGRIAFLLFLAGITLGGVNAFFYTRSLNRIQLEVAYPIFSAGSIILVTLASIFFFSEAFSLRQAFGIVAIMLGIVLLTSA
jgi:undecaprenyl phosphate-alpha-L-ara4N flippase subunit ArnE